MGHRGPPGPAVRDAVTWFPFLALQIFRENSTSTFYFNTADDRILKKDQTPMGLKDHYGELKRKSQVRNAICIQNFQQPVKLPFGYYSILSKIRCKEFLEFG